jgi:hypothetical protein
MRKLRRRLTYVNVVGTLALFLVLAGGVVWAGSKISGKTIKKNSQPGNRIKKNTITSNRVKDNTLLSADFAGGAPGTTVLDITASNISPIPPLPASTPITFTGTTSFTPSRKARVNGRKVTFTPANGHSYLAMFEAKGNVVDVDGPGGGFCLVEVDVNVNGVENMSHVLVQQLGAPPPDHETQNITWQETPVALIDKGQPQTFTGRVIANAGCGPSTRIDSIRVLVNSFG